MNNVTNDCRFLGRLVSDPRLIKTKSDVDLVTFTLAVPEYRREKNGDKKKNVSYFDFEAWDTGAATIAKYSEKGDEIFVHASARPNIWTDSEGVKRYQVKFRVKEFKLFNFKTHNETNNEADTENEEEKALETISAENG